MIHSAASLLEQSFDWLSKYTGRPIAALIMAVLVPVLIGLLVLAMDRD